MIIRIFNCLIIQSRISAIVVIACFSSEKTSAAKLHRIVVDASDIELHVAQFTSSQQADFY